MKNQPKYPLSFAITIWGLVLILSALAWPALAQETSTRTYVVPETATINVGETVDVAVNIENVTNLYTIDLQISFNPTNLEVVDADPSTPGIQVMAGDMLIPDIEDANDVQDGKITFYLTQIMPNPPASGSGMLVFIKFRGKAPGTPAITLDSVQLYDDQGSPIDTIKNHGLITVVAPGEAPPPTPQPTTPSPPTPTPGTTPAATPEPTMPPPTLSQPTAPPPPPAVECANIQGHHVTRRGETLYAIGRAYAVDPHAIAACNPLSDPRVIHASLRLAIPLQCWSPVPAGPTAQAQFTPRGCG